MATAGSVLIDILARTASFVTDMGRAEKATRNFKKEALDLKSIFAGSFFGAALASGLSELVRGLAQVPGALNDIVKEAGNLQDLADRIGASAEEFAGFGIAAATAGTSMESLAEFSTKLTKALSKIDDESEGAGKALAALGIPLEEFKKLDPVQQIERLSKALASFQKGPEQTAVLEALVKGGSQLLPFLKELEQQGGRTNLLTKEQIELADQFSDAQAKSAAQLKAFVQAAVIPTIPALTALTTSIKDVLSELSEFDSATGKFKKDNPLVAFAEDAARAVATMLDFFAATTKELSAIVGAIKSIRTAVQQATTGDAAGARKTLVDAFTPSAQEAGDKAATTFLGAFEDRLRKQKLNLSGVRFDASTDPRSTTFGQPIKPKIDISGLVKDEGGKDDPTKKLLDNRIKALDISIKREEQLLTSRNRALDGLNTFALQSFQAFSDAQIAIIEASTSAQVEAINKQIALVDAARKRPGIKETDKADLDRKSLELVEKRTQVQEEADRKIIEATSKKTAEEKRFSDQIETTRATVFELQGNLAAAAAIRFDIQNQELIKRADAERNDVLKDLLATLKQASIEQAKFAEGADLRSLNASLLELQGNLAAAAAIRFDEQNFSIIERFRAQKNTQALELVQTLKAATIAQAEFTRITEQHQRIVSDLSIREDRIAISRKLGATTELGALKQLGEARTDAVAKLQLQIDGLDAIKDKTPAQIQALEQLRVKLEELAATADPLGDKFRTVFSDSFSDPFADFISGTKTAKEAIKDFADNVLQQINRIISQNIAESLFGKQGVFGGVGDLFSQALGGGGSAGGSAAKTTADAAAVTSTTSLATATAAAAATVSASTPTIVGGLGELAFAAKAAAAALSEISGKKGAEAAGEFIDFGAFFAEGGSPPVGKVSVGGEKGRELFLRKSGLQAMVQGAQPVSGLSVIGQNGPQFFRPTVPGIVVPAEETEQILRRISGFGGSYQWGGSPPVGMGSLGGEDGREMFIPITKGMKPPEVSEHNVKKEVHFHQPITFMPQGQITRATQSQIATDVGRSAQAALTRGNA